MRYWHFLIDRLHYLITISVVILALLTFRISSISNVFLAQTFDSEQRLRAVIKINMIFQRGVGKSVMALEVNDQDMLYDGIDLIESTIGYISTKDYFTDELNNTLIPYIDTVISEIEEINAGYLQKGVPVPREAIMKISDISDEMFRLLSKEDFDNWNKLSYDNSKLAGQFKHTRTLIIVTLIIVSTMLVVLIRSLRFRKNAEIALRDAHDKLEIKVQERTQDLSELNTNLEQEIVERKRAEEKIHNALKEKELLLKEIHHRVKNNMAIVSSLLGMQSKFVKDEGDRDMFLESRERIRSMGLIHDKLYNDGNLSNIDIKSYTKSLVSGLFQTYHRQGKSIDFKVNVGDVQVGIDEAVPYALILNELITNSLKYAFTDDKPGEIEVRLSLDEEEKVEIVVSDNGCGMPEGFDFKRTETLGLQIVNSLVEQLNGDMELDSSRGTCFTITFQKPKHVKRI